MVNSQRLDTEGMASGFRINVSPCYEGGTEPGTATRNSTSKQVFLLKAIAEHLHVCQPSKITFIQVFNVRISLNTTS